MKTFNQSFNQLIVLSTFSLGVLGVGAANVRNRAAAPTPVRTTSPIVATVQEPNTVHDRGPFGTEIFQNGVLRPRILKGNFMVSSSGSLAFDVTRATGTERAFSLNLSAAPMVFIMDYLAVGFALDAAFLYTSSTGSSGLAIGPAATYYVPLTDHSSASVGAKWAGLLGFSRTSIAVANVTTSANSFYWGFMHNDIFFYGLRLEGAYNYFPRDDLSISPYVALENGAKLQTSVGFNVEKYF